VGFHGCLSFVSVRFCLLDLDFSATSEHSNRPFCHVRAFVCVCVIESVYFIHQKQGCPSAPIMIT
jgi:hypothetical protein